VQGNRKRYPRFSLFKISDDPSGEKLWTRICRRKLETPTLCDASSERHGIEAYARMTVLPFHARAHPADDAAALAKREGTAGMPLPSERGRQRNVWFTFGGTHMFVSV